MVDGEEVFAFKEQKVTPVDFVSCRTFWFLHAMTYSVIYYSTDASKHEIDLLNNIDFKVFMKRNFLPQFFYCIRKMS